MGIFYLAWPLDTLGYEIDERAEEPSGRVANTTRRLTTRRSAAYPATFLPLVAGGTFIVRKGGQLDWTRRPMKVPGLCRMLAECEKTPAGALGFISKFGFLHRADAKEQLVDEVYSAIDQARWLHEAVEQKEWRQISEALAQAGQTGLSHHGGVGRLGVLFNLPPGTERPELRFAPASLLEAAYIQILDDAASGADLKRCKSPACDKYFRRGAGTNHRTTAEYCSTSCRTRHAYLRRIGRAK